jgi:hypothetical protein
MKNRKIFSLFGQKNEYFSEIGEGSSTIKDRLVCNKLKVFDRLKHFFAFIKHFLATNFAFF